MVDEDGTPISAKSAPSETRVSIAAVPKESIDPKYNLFSEKYVDDCGSKWELIYLD